MKNQINKRTNEQTTKVDRHILECQELDQRGFLPPGRSSSHRQLCQPGSRCKKKKKERNSKLVCSVMSFGLIRIALIFIKIAI